MARPEPLTTPSPSSGEPSPAHSGCEPERSDASSHTADMLSFVRARAQAGPPTPPAEPEPDPERGGFPEVSLSREYGGALPLFPEEPRDDDEVLRSIVDDLENYGLCVLDNFLGRDKGLSILQEVLDMYSAGVFEVSVTMKLSFYALRNTLYLHRTDS